MKRFLTVSSFAASLFLFFFAAVTEAASMTGRYRIELRDGTQIETRGYPVARGSVWTFHSASGGALSGVPREMVARIVPADEDAVPEEQATARAVAAPSAEGDLEEAPPPLEPGELIELVPTGDGPGATPPAPAAAGRVGAPVYVNGYGGLPNPYYGNSVYGTSNILAPGAVGPDGMPVVLSSTDLSRALSATTPAGSTASNGFPTLTTSSPTMIGPDGTPILSSAASTQFQIGPDGTPVMVGSGGAAPVTTIGPNGTPVLAPSGTPGAAGPVIGSNGTPILAGSGPGSAAPMIGPNGTPILAPSGFPGAAFPVIGPNGTPAVPAPGHH